MIWKKGEGVLKELAEREERIVGGEIKKFESF